MAYKPAPPPLLPGAASVHYDRELRSLDQTLQNNASSLTSLQSQVDTIEANIDTVEAEYARMADNETIPGAWTITGDWTYNGYPTFNNGFIVPPDKWLRASRIRESNSQGLVVAAGESASVVDASLDVNSEEVVWLVSETGVKVISSRDNWATGIANINTTIIGDASGRSYFPDHVEVGNDIYIKGSSIIFGDGIGTINDYVTWTSGGTGLRGFENGLEIWRLGADIRSFRDVLADGEVRATNDVVAGRYLVGDRVHWGAFSSTGDWIQWVTANGLYGFENGNRVFRIGGAQCQITAAGSLTTSNTPNMWTNTDGEIRRSTSTGVFKDGYERLRPEKVKSGEKHHGTDPLDIISRLNPLSFESLHPIDQKEDGTRLRLTGFIAEEVAEVYPEASVEEGQNYDTRAVLALAVSAIQQLEDRVKQLEAALNGRKIPDRVVQLEQKVNGQTDPTPIT